jgi:hypothetical protein
LHYFRITLFSDKSSNIYYFFRSFCAWYASGGELCLSLTISNEAGTAPNVKNIVNNHPCKVANETPVNIAPKLHPLANLAPAPIRKPPSANKSQLYNFRCLKSTNLNLLANNLATVAPIIIPIFCHD